MTSDEDRGPLFGGTIRWIPRHVWWRVFIGRVRHPGHKWMYRGIVRRDTFTMFGWGLIVMRMPSTYRERPAESTSTS
jgi:hypothetical protein